MSPSTSSSTIRKIPRIPRACDRCRMKKAKCDGRHQCNQCAAHDSPCTYTHRKHHPATNYYLQMLNLSNEAIRRMYIACRDKGCFPGHLPIDGHDRNISIHAILEGLGLLTDGMLPSDAPSEEFGWRCPSQPNVYDARPPRAKSGSSNITMDDIDGTSLQRVNGFPSSNSAHSSTSQQSFDDIAISPTTAVHSFNSIQQHHDTGSSYLHNLDFISFCSQSNAIPMDGLANTATTGTAPLLNDFLIPWPATFAVEMHSTEY